MGVWAYGIWDGIWDWDGLMGLGWGWGGLGVGLGWDGLLGDGIWAASIVVTQTYTCQKSTHRPKLSAHSNASRLY